MHYISDNQFDLTAPHTLTGQIALWLMLGYAIWATSVVKRNDELLRKNFTDIIWLFG